MADETLTTSRKLSTLDLAWAAGFLEGEGSFSAHDSPEVTAAQVQYEPIGRLIRIFGGKAYQRRTNGFSEKKIWIWSVNTRRSIQVMMTLYVLMSSKRQEEIRKCIDKWRSGRLLKSHHSDVCGVGHPLIGDNVRLVRGKYKNCRTCFNQRRRERRAAGRKN